MNISNLSAFEYVFVLLFTLSLSAVVVLAVRTYKIKRTASLHSNEGLVVITSICLLAFQVLLAFQQNHITNTATQASQQALDVARQNQHDFRMVNLEYRAWTARLQKNPSEMTLYLRGQKRKTTLEFQCFELLIKPLFLDRNNLNIIDDPYTESLPFLTFSCQDVPFQEPDDSTVTLKVAAIIDKYQKRFAYIEDVVERFAESNFSLHSIYIRVHYWHSSDKDPIFSHEGYGFSDDWQGAGSTKSYPIHLERDKFRSEI